MGGDLNLQGTGHILWEPEPSKSQSPYRTQECGVTEQNGSSMERSRDAVEVGGTTGWKQRMDVYARSSNTMKPP